MDELVSVIVPVYNVKDHILKCIDSILEQSYTKLEVILIDDGSIDGSYELCYEYSKRDYRVIVHKQENRGVASARNKGLSLATGEYICFVDADDYISKYCIELLLRNLKDADADISLASYSKRNNLIEKLTELNVEIWSNKETLEQYSINQRFIAGVVCKLFPKRIIAGLEFKPGLRIAEDKLFTFQAIQRCEKIVFQDATVYCYYQRPGSAMHSNFDERYLDNKYVSDLLYESWCSRYPELKDMFYKDKILSYVRSVQDGLLDNSEAALRLRFVFLNEVKQCDLKKIKDYCNTKESILLFLEKYCIGVLYIFEQCKRIKRNLQRR